MKKILLFSIVFLLLCFSTVCAQGTIQCVNTTLAINGVDTDEFESGFAEVNASFKNNGNTDETVTVVISEYSENDGLVIMRGTSFAVKTIPAGKTASITPGLKITSDTAKVKCFAYISKNLHPIAVKDFMVQEFKVVDVEDSLVTVYEFNAGGVNPEIEKAEITGIELPAVCKWADNKKAAVSVTIDDGVYESAVVYNKLQKKYGIHSTQFMITRKLYNEDDGKVNTNLVSDWQDIFDDGYMDLGNHSYSHKIHYKNPSSYTTHQLVDDITGSYYKLCELFPKQDVIAFAAPWMEAPDNAYKEMTMHHYAVRDKFENAERILIDQQTAEVLNSMVDEVIAGGGFAYELYHTIENGGQFTITEGNVDKHFKYLGEKSESGDLWPGSYTEVVKYICERNSAETKILWATKSSMGISLSDSMDDELFDYPLTLKVNLPDSWSGKIHITQNSKYSESGIFEEGGRKYAYINVIPDGGSVVIRP